MRSAARRLSRVLGQVPSFTWGALYLLAIPGFGALYSLFPGHFYHSTAHFEPTLESDRRRLELRVEAAIYRSFLAAHGSKTFGVGSDRVSVDDIRVRLLPPPSPDSEFAFQAMGVTATGRLAFGSQDSTVYRLTVVGEGIASQRPHAAFPCPAIEILTGPLFDADEACLEVSRDTADGLEAYFQSLVGFPSVRASGHFWRMVYFSAVTITTLGYGDIVPLTARARGWVTIEIVLGPLLFGLFLNSLVRENTRQIADSGSGGQRGPTPQS